MRDLTTEEREARLEAIRRNLEFVKSAAARRSIQLHVVAETYCSEVTDLLAEIDRLRALVHKLFQS